MTTRAVLWDLGNVLIDWSPRRLYEKLFRTPEEVDQFLSEVCTMDWHAAHDRGVSMAENREPLIEAHPHLEDAIRAWESGFEGMVDGTVDGTAEVMDALAGQGVPQYALTNMPAEWMEPVNRLYPSMRHMRDVIVSAHEGVIKPDRKIYEITAARLPHEPGEVLFFDDRESNVLAARDFGFDAEIFTGADSLHTALASRGLPSLARV
ncbi:MAG: HAD family phosphatase [Alphaproteobacteria bacterium]|uniref:HAD family hydrolase n=1 Tax=Maricaulis alexandrii TaxID=2570354 RepID=UPI0011082785|nr:HAD family phosphatase [Maricaulis alexandrii]MCR9267206.1 HAD family phosphatase [Alphaproteobacteria bacterium]